MTTTAKATLGELLRQKRAGGPKAPIYKMLGVPAQTYDYWEGGLYLPREPEHIEALAKWLDCDEEAFVLDIHRERKARQGQPVGGYVSLFSQPTPALAA